MDALLALLIVLVAFAVLIYLISRSVKLIMVVGIAFIVVMVLRYSGLLRW